VAAIVPNLQILEARPLGFFVLMSVALFDQFPLQRGEEALGHRAVPAVALAAHAAGDPVLGQERLAVARGVLQPQSEWCRRFAYNKRLGTPIRVHETEHEGLKKSTSS
jgi:hypothetical protein